MERRRLESDLIAAKEKIKPMEAKLIEAKCERWRWSGEKRRMETDLRDTKKKNHVPDRVIK
jgi:hypothetical protein